MMIWHFLSSSSMLATCKTTWRHSSSLFFCFALLPNLSFISKVSGPSWMGSGGWVVRGLEGRDSGNVVISGGALGWQVFNLWVMAPVTQPVFVFSPLDLANTTLVGGHQSLLSTSPKKPLCLHSFCLPSFLHHSVALSAVTHNGAIWGFPHPQMTPGSWETVIYFLCKFH